MRLGGWQRLGIILSVVWLVVVPVQGWWTTLNAERRVSRAAQKQYDECIKIRPHQPCLDEQMRRLNALPPLSGTTWLFWYALVGFGPVLLGWLTGPILIGLGRWVLRGFQK